MMPIEVIRPAVFEKCEALTSFFTLKNASLFSDSRQIKGLNIGFNTDEAPEIVKQNRQALIKAFDLDSGWIAFADQVHGNRVEVVTSGGTFANTDGLITQVPGLALAIQTADCAAVLMADMHTQTIAAIHAGWRGAAGDIVPRAVEKMIQLGVQMGNCMAFISPSISVRHFEVGAEVAEQFPEQFVNYEQYEKPHIDLKRFLRYQLERVGVRPENIGIDPGCTVEDDKQFYSYRREGAMSGRMMGGIQLGRFLANNNLL
jgi:YfiH family protein